MTHRSEVALRPRVLIVGRARFSPSPSPAERARWEALGAQLDFRVLAAGDRPSADARLKLLSPGRSAPWFYARLTLRAALEIRRWDPQLIHAKSPHDAICAFVARALAGRRVPVITDVHGDWRASARLYGGPGRRALAPLADRAASGALRASAGTRALSAYTGSLARAVTGEDPLGLVPTFFDSETFFSPPPVPVPDSHRLVYVGTLQPVKNIALLCAAWREVASTAPRVQLVIVGDGPLRTDIDQLRAAVPGTVIHHPRLEPAELVSVLDSAVALVLLSASEGLGRVAIEAFARGRPVIGARTGGIPDVVGHGRNGLLVDVSRPDAAAQAMRTLLEDHELAARLGEQARRDAAVWRWSPERYAAAIGEIMRLALARATALR